MKTDMQWCGMTNGMSDFSDVYSGGTEMIDRCTAAKQKKRKKKDVSNKKVLVSAGGDTYENVYKNLEMIKLLISLQ